MGDVQPVRDSLAKASDDENSVAMKARKYFQEMLPDAQLEIRRILKMSSNEKLRKELAVEIVELAGAGAGPKTGQVVINDSQVQLLLNVGREVLGS